MRRYRNRLVFAASLAAGLLAALSVAAFAGGILPSEPDIAAPAEPGVAPLSVMHVFDRPVAAGEQVSVGGQKGLESVSRDEAGVPSSLLPGPADIPAARALISNAGPSRWSLVAAPTSKGQVCRALLDAGHNYKSGGCVSGFPDDAPAIPSMTRWGSGTTVVSGLASDAVAEIAVMVDGQARRALLQNNGFLLELSTPDGINGMRVTLKDGSTVLVPLEPFDLSA